MSARCSHGSTSHPSLLLMQQQTQVVLFKVLSYKPLTLGYTQLYIILTGRHAIITKASTLQQTI
jgi:hypothetical protein